MRFISNQKTKNQLGRNNFLNKGIKNKLIQNPNLWILGEKLLAINFLVTKFLTIAHLGFASCFLLGRIKNLWRKGLLCLRKRSLVFLCYSFLLSCLHYSVAQFYFHASHCSIAFVFAPLIFSFVHHVATLVHCVISFKYFAFTHSITLVFCFILVVFPIPSFVFCVCLELPPCPLLHVRECGVVAYYNKFSLV